MKINFFYLSLIILFTSGASAQMTEESDYTFGGSCASTGSWTQKALARTAEIKSIIKRLNLVSECKSLGDFLDKNVTEGTAELTEQSSTVVAQQMENIPNRESALIFNAGSGDANYQYSILQALLKERFNLASANSFNAVHHGFVGLSGAITTKVMDQASNLINTLATALPTFDGCLLHQSKEAGNLLSQIVGLSASMVGPTGGVNSALMASVTNVINMLSTPAFGGVLKTLDKTQFWHSMACLMETTSEAYCSVLDANHLLKKDYLAQKATIKDNKVSFGDPLKGYEVLVLHIPNIANWIKRVQFGIEPQWDTDAQFKISAFENTANYMTSAWNILGTFNGMKSIYQTQPNLQTKKNFLLEMLKAVVLGVQRGAQSVDFKTMGSDLNFFTQVQQRDAIPFYLVGIHDNVENGRIPELAVRNKLGGAGLDWDKYMKGDGSFKNPDDGGEIERTWHDPDILLGVIEKNLRKLIEDANTRASDFYQQRIIVNQPNLVASALSSTQFTVRNSFDVLNGYLKQLDEMFTKGDSENSDNQDQKSLIGVIRNLQSRVASALMAFEQLKKLEGVTVATDEDRALVNQTYQNVVNTVYKEFDVLYQRDSFISSAIVELVRADYAFRIRHNIGFGEYEKQLITASGEDFINLIKTLHGFNPVAARGDISFATDANENNLIAVELAFGDPLARTIDELNMYLTGKSVGDFELNKRSARRLWKDTFSEGIFSRDNWGTRGFSALFGWMGQLYVQNSLRKDRYQFPMGRDRIIRPKGDNSVGGWEYFRNQLCILSLSFENKTDYSDLCKGAVLPSLYDSKDPNFVLNASYDKLLDPANSKNLEGQIDSATYQENTRCAFRNYHRRNLVFRLTDLLKAGTARAKEIGN